MTTLTMRETEYRGSNPVDITEDLAGANDWGCERQSEDELTLFLNGHYTDFQFRIFWRGELRTLQFACLFDLKAPEPRRNEIYKLISMINERLWIGHFEYWLDEGLLLFRHASLMTDPLSQIDETHINMIIETAIEESERFYPAFQYVMWGGQNADEAMEASLLECVGNA